MNNGKEFSSLDGVTCSYVTSALTSFSFYQDSDKPKGIGFLEALKDPNHLKTILIAPGIMRSLKFKTKGMVEPGNY